MPLDPSITQLPDHVQTLIKNKKSIKATFQLLAYYRSHSEPWVREVLIDQAYKAIWGSYAAGFYDWMRQFARLVIDLGKDIIPILTLAKTYNGLALAYHHLGETDLQFNQQAKTLFEQALQEASTPKEQKSIVQSLVKNNFGIVIRQGFNQNRTHAETLIQETIAYCEAHSLPFETAQAFKIYGELLFYFKETQAAFSWFHKALALFQTQKTKAAYKQGFDTLLLMAENSVQLNAWEQAAAFLEQAEQAQDTNRVSFQIPFLKACIQEARSIPNAPPNHIPHSPESNTDPKKQTILELLLHAQTILEQERWQIQSESGQSGFLARNRREEVYLKTISYQIQLDMPWNALQTLELFRGRIFIDRFTSQEWANLGGAPVDLVERRKQVLEQLATVLKKVNPDQAAIHALEEELYRVEEEIATVKPIYAWFNTDDLSLEDCQHALDPDHLVLLFFYFNDQITWFLLTQSSVSMHTAPVLQSYLLDLINAYRKELRKPPTPSSKKVLEYYHTKFIQLLVQPVVNHCTEFQRIILIPYGQLHHIPLTVLFYEAMEQPAQFKSITNLPGLKALPFLKHPVDLSTSLGIFVNPRHNLPASQKEGEQLYSMALDATWLCNQHCDKQAFMQLLHSKSLIHYSGHIHTNLDKPLYSYLEAASTISSTNTSADAPSTLQSNSTFQDHTSMNTPDAAFQPDEQDSQRIYLKDIYQIYSSHFTFISLGGCSSGISRGYHGEEWVGFLRGFFYAGATGVLASLWDIEDASAGFFYTRFYEYVLKQNKRLDEAYWLAVHDLKQEYHHPYFYAPYILYGVV